MVRTFPRKELSAVLVLALLLNGCGTGTMDRPYQSPQIKDHPHEVAQPRLDLGGIDAPAIQDVPIADDLLLARPLRKSDPLPKTIIPAFSVQSVPLGKVVSLLAAEARIGLVVDPKVAEMELRAVDNVSGPLDVVIERLVQSMGLLYSFSGNVLSIKERDRFLVKVPPMSQPGKFAFDISAGGGENDCTSGSGGIVGTGGTGGTGSAGNSSGSGTGQSLTKAMIVAGPDPYQQIREMIANFTGDTVDHVVFDRQTLEMSFTASADSFASVEAYLDDLRRGRVQITYDSWFLETSLSDGRDFGVNWQNFQFGQGQQFNLGAAGQEPATTALGAAGLFGEILTAGFTNHNFSIQAVGNFLQGVGDTVTKVKPTINIESGNMGKLDAVDRQCYTSAFNIVQSTSVNGAPIYAPILNQVITGTQVLLTADYQDGRVTSSVNLRVSDLLGWTQSGSGPTATQQPKTSERNYSGQVSARPGDVILIGGIITQKAQQQHSGIPLIGDSGFPLVSRQQEATDRAELTLIMRPRITRFMPEKQYLALHAADYRLDSPMAPARGSPLLERTSEIAEDPKKEMAK